MKPESVTYRWYRDGAQISGATAATYKLTTADRGKKITVAVKGSKAGYQTVTKTSAATYIPKVFYTVTPKITGTMKAGYTVTAARGSWSPTPTYSYQWYCSGVKITNTQPSVRWSAARVGVSVMNSRSAQNDSKPNSVTVAPGLPSKKPTASTAVSIHQARTRWLNCSTTAGL